MIDFIIMDNHAHFLLLVKSAKQLGNFARCVNSQIATFINKLLKKDSQVIRDRFKSPVVMGISYFRNLVGYIWFNRHRKDRKSDPGRDTFCSLYHRLKRTPISQCLESYTSLGLCSEHYEQQYLNDLLSVAKEIYYQKKVNRRDAFFNALKDTITIGDQATVEKRCSYIRELMRKTKKEQDAAKVAGPPPSG